jgi:hypothetical protein
MRAAAGLLTILCTGALSLAQAAEAPLGPPQTETTPTAQQSAAAPAAEHSTAAPAAASPAVGTMSPAAAAPASAATPAPAATSPAAADAGKPQLTREEHDLISRGYKLEIRHGDKYFCRREAELGSHFDVKTCNTAESIESHRANSVETVREMQANKPEISN